YYTGIASESENVGLIFLMQGFKREWFNKWDHLSDAVELELLTDFVGRIQRHDRLIIVAKVNRLYQSVANFVAVGRVIVLQYHLLLVRNCFRMLLDKFSQPGLEKQPGHAVYF